MPVSEKQIIIIGAGVAGLACARELERFGLSPLIVEKGAKVGGRVQSDESDGFIFDHGFQVLPSSYEMTFSLTGPMTTGSFKSGALIWDGSKVRRLFDPRRHPEELFHSLFSGVFTPLDYLRLLELVAAKTFHPERPTAERLAEFGFSHRSVELFFRPFFGGVFRDPSLSTSECFLQFAVQHFSSGQALLPRGGMRVVPESIAAKLQRSGLVLEAEVEEIRADKVLLRGGRNLPAEIVIVATDGEEAARLTNRAKPTWQLAYTYYFEAPRSPLCEPVLLLNGSGEGSFNTIAVLSDIEPSYAPPGTSLVSISTFEECSAEELLTECQKLFGEQVREWSFLRSVIIERALPSGAGTSAEPPLPENLFLCGDAPPVPSIENAVRSGIETARRVGETLGLSYEETSEHHRLVPERSSPE